MEPLKTENKTSYANDVKNKFQSAENSIVKSASQTADKMGSAASQFADRASDYYESSQKYVRQNPVRSVAIAAAAGAVVASLLSMISGRKS